MRLWASGAEHAMHINRRSLAGVFSGAAVAAATPRVAAAEPMPASLELRNMTWLDIKSAIASGATTVMIPTGGVEQNGPHMVLGKHDTIVATAALRIARDVGNTLVAPVVSYVPQGTIDPPTGNMVFPGTLGIPEPVFEATLDGIAQSLKHAGFKDIAFMGDHGLSQAAQVRVAQRLTKAWAPAGVRVHNLDQYYDDRAQITAMKGEGETDASIGSHAGLLDTAELMSLNAKSVDLARLAVQKGGLTAVGASGDPARASITRGAQLLKMRTDAGATQLKALIKK
jgi:creatinine amidohydrolase